MQRCSTTVDIREKQIKALLSYHYIPIRMAKIKNTSAGEDAEKLDHFTLLVRMQNGIATLENSLAVSYKFQSTVPKDPAISLLVI